MRISKTLYRDNPADTAWGDLRWHSRHIVYNNPESWADAPSRPLENGATYLDFD